MSVLNNQRSIRLGLTALAFIVCTTVFYYLEKEASIRLSGWLCMSLMFVLFLFGLRKKLNYIPLGRAAVWAQAHYYMGILLTGILIAHIWSTPQISGANLLLLVFCSLTLATGVIGLFASRVYPPVLVKRGQQVLYDQIPAKVTQIRNEVEELLESNLVASKSPVMINLYQSQLQAYLLKPKNFLLHAIDSPKPFLFWKATFRDVRPYLLDGEQEVVDRIEALTRQKTILDLNLSIYQILRYWLFFHIPLSIATIVLSVLHAFQMLTY